MTTAPPPDPDTCQLVELDDGEVLRVHGSGEWTDADRAAMSEIVRAVRRRFEAEQQAEPECSSCHTVAGHPHTEYCQLVDHASQLTHLELYGPLEGPNYHVCSAPRDALPGGRPCSDDSCPVHAQDDPDQATHDTACQCPACVARPYVDPAGAWMAPGCTCNHRFGTELEHDDLCPARDWDA